MAPPGMNRERGHSITNEDSDDDIVPLAVRRRRIVSPASRASTTNDSVIIPPIYHDVLHDEPDGIAFLLSARFSKTLADPAQRVATIYRITPAQALEELRRFLLIKVFTVDTDAVKISPTPLMDELWHAAVLDTRFYADLQNALGVVLHHNPSGASDQDSEARARRLSTMKALYKSFFEEAPLRLSRHRTQPTATTGYPPNINIVVKTLTGKNIKILIGPYLTMLHLCHAITDKEGIPSDLQRIIFRGFELSHDTVLKDVGIQEGSLVHMVLNMAGC